jgi:alkanesulfonate monooxygenase SsuD/methylene tetrahydromethanopterin reductase-like flavin-dependent oxidoreductase (luciferase family)
MKYAFILPGGTAVQQLEQAVLAEEYGWDGVFVWEAPYGVDAWSLLAAIAARTSRVRLGTMLTPLPWRRPWKVASQVATLDQLSAGRATLAVGLGAVWSGDPGDVTDRRAKADLLDEGLDIVQGLWAGRQAYTGERYRLALDEREDLATVGRPVQSRIPIWVVGAWPRPKSMRRVLRCDGVLPAGEAETPDGIRAMRTWLTDNGAPPGFDVLSEGETPAADPAAARDLVRPWAEAGCTWWMETRWEMPHHSDERMAQVHERLIAGPPS